MAGMGYVLAQVNIGVLSVPRDGPLIADFVNALDPVNALADAAPGFIWRLRDEAGNAMDFRAFEDEGTDILLNMSVWESVEDLAAFVYGNASHRDVLRRRREWFKKLTTAYAALWWIPRGHIPAVPEAEDRVRHLRLHGPTPYSFTMKEHFPPPDSGDVAPLHSPDDWACTVAGA